MEKFNALMKRKVLGVPVIYLAVIVAAAVLYMAIRTPKPAEEAAEETADEEGDADLDFTTSASQPVFVTQTGAPTQVAEFTNDMWARQAVEWLIGQGKDTALASSAMNKYINGENLTYQEGELRDLAVKQFGLPPESLSPSKTLGYTGPASKQGEAPTNHTVRGKSDNSFAELARLYYGSDNVDYVTQIRARNGSVTEPLTVGQVVRIPEAHNPRYYRATSATRTLYAIAKKNAVSPSKITNLNPNTSFPVAVGTRVRIA